MKSSRLRVVLDTNVLISAIFWRGLPNQLLNAWREQRFQLIFSPHCLAELLAKLELKFDMSPDQVRNGEGFWSVKPCW